MIKSHKKRIEYLTNICEFIECDIPTLNKEVSNIANELNRIKYYIKNIGKEIKYIEDHLLEKDTETVIFNGKKYRIANYELSKPANSKIEKSTLELDCVEEPCWISEE